MAAPRHSAADEILTSATAWGIADVYARQAMWRARDLARQEGVALYLPVDADLARAAWVWLLWDQSRGRSHRDHPGAPSIAGPFPSRVPEHASAYQRQLLEELLEADTDRRDGVAVAVGLLTAADRTVVDQGRDGAGDGEAQTSLTAFGVRLVDGSGVEVVACPVCEETNGLGLAWDGFVVTGTCPHGHGEWTATAFGPQEWQSLVRQGLTQADA